MNYNNINQLIIEINYEVLLPIPNPIFISRRKLVKSENNDYQFGHYLIFYFQLTKIKEIVLQYLVELHKNIFYFPCYF